MEENQLDQNTGQPQENNRTLSEERKKIIEQLNREWQEALDELYFGMAVARTELTNSMEKEYGKEVLIRQSQKKAKDP